MKTKIIIILVCSLLIATVLPSISSSFIIRANFNDRQYYEFVPGEFIVKFTDDTKIPSSSVEKLNEKYQVNSIEKIFKKSEKTILDNIYILNIPKDSDILSIVNDYSSKSYVEYAEPNYIVHLCNIPNDEKFSKQWALHNIGQTGGTIDADIDAPEAWDIETGDNNIVITISDTGVDLDHPDLADNIWINEDEIPNNGKDDDGNGFIDDIHGWDFVNNDNDPMDDNGHGTCCAGIAGAVTDNNVGMAGICWNCRIMSVKGLNEEGTGSSVDNAEGIVYAADNGADVISMSWGGPNSNLKKNAVNYAYLKGVLLVAAAGNDYANQRIYPAAYDKVIAVAATDSYDEKAGFSNYGSWVDVAAPGVHLYTTIFDNSYTNYFGGTSGATPHVAGLAGLIWSENPGFNQDELLTIIRSTTDRIESDQHIGTGKINAYKAILRDSTPIVKIDSSLDDDQVINEVNIKGTANGSTFVNYIIGYGEGIYPEEWIQIHTSSTPVNDDVLAFWKPPPPPDEETFYTIRLLVYDNLGQVSEDQVVVVLNMAPPPPNIDGLTIGLIGEEYEYTFVTRDPYKDPVYYYIEWGDGTFEDWIGPEPSGKKLKLSHNWTEIETYTIRCKAKDIYNLESDWAELTVTMPRNRIATNSLFLRLYQIMRYLFVI